MRMKDEEWEKVLQVNLTGTFRPHRGGDARHDAPPHGG
jgi:NAD(P)-dependent dehydrogenase (short-subunit alcohol dehydrogenase family)